MFRYAWILAIGWTVIIVAITILDVRKEKQSTRETAISQARAYFNKDTALRLWATRYGRIYVPVGEHYQPNPLLAHIPDRDVTTPAGIELTMINPATIIHQLDDNFSDLYGVSGRITSLRPLRSENLPDEWEKNALQQFQAGKQEVLEFTRINGEPVLRLIQPLKVEAGCLLCHGRQGFQVGDVAGGVGIKLPLQDLLAREHNEIIEEGIGILLLWLTGLVAIIIGYLRLRRQSIDRMQAIVALESSERRKSAVMEAALDCIVSIDANGQVIEFNPAAERTFGYRREDVIGQDMAELLIPVSKRESHHQGLRRQLSNKESRILNTRIETEALRSDGSEITVELTITRLDIDGEVIFTAFLRDITEARYMSEQLTWQATHDVLTGLSNRHVFGKRLTELAEADHDEHHFLMYMDLDQFKVVNDYSGHGAGDELLRQLSALLQEQIQIKHVLARLGGDEFGLLLENCTLECAQEIAGRLLEAVRQFRFYWQDASFSVGISIGVVEISGSGETVPELLGAADAACYKAKEEGRNRMHLFQPDDQDLVRRRGEIVWISKIESAFEENRFLLYHQRMCQCAVENEDIYLEILLRMKDRNGKLITPDRFIPSAERYKLMPSIDRWVIRKTFKWLSENENVRQRIRLCSINISGYSVADPYLQAYILDQLHEFGILPGIICFEITETAAITNLSQAMDFMGALHNKGCLFALDDFGSGMSSYGYLKRLPVDFLKIDGEFVRDIVFDNISHAMVRSIHEIGHIMGKKTIAEYVESEEILEMLTKLGVDLAQGYAIHEPQPLDELLSNRC